MLEVTSVTVTTVTMITVIVIIVLKDDTDCYNVSGTISVALPAVWITSFTTHHKTGKWILFLIHFACEVMETYSSNSPTVTRKRGSL